MKKIIFIQILTLFSISLFAQDSSNTKVTVRLRASDVQFMAVYFDHNNKYEDLDSTAKAITRASNPTGSTAMTFANIEVRAWLDIARKMADNVSALHNNTFKRLNDSLRIINNVWLTHKLDVDANDKAILFDLIRSAGRTYLRKEEQ